MKNPLKTKMRIRFVLLAMLGLLLLQSAIVAISIYNNYRDMVTKSDLLISQLHKGSGTGSRYFSVKIPAGSQSVYPDAVQHVSVTAQQATEYAQSVLKQGRQSGFVDVYRYHVYQNDSGTKIYFLYRESSMEMCRAAAENLIGVSLAGLICIGLLLIPVSGWVVAPLMENHRKQKQFITSASHELKTPLTVISTNTQLLETELGENQWLEGIRQQVDHLVQMTDGLVALSKAEEYENPVVKAQFSLSRALADIMPAFRLSAQQKDISLSCSVPEDLCYEGSETEIVQLCRILLDNACKYTPEHGSIALRAKPVRRGVLLQLRNTAADLAGEELQALSMRFHRGQNAAGATGSGLGLSIAQAIANRHNGQLTVSTDTEGNFLVEVMLH